VRQKYSENYFNVGIKVVKNHAPAHNYSNTAFLFVVVSGGFCGMLVSYLSQQKTEREM